MDESDSNAFISTEELPSSVKHNQPSKRGRQNRAQRREAKRIADDEADLDDGSSSSTLQHDESVTIERSDLIHPTSIHSAAGTEKCDRVGGEAQQKPSKRQPNYFIALPIIDDAIRSKLEDVQRTLVESQACLKRTLVNTRTSHLTLHVFHLDEKNLDDARQALKASVDAIKSECDFRSLTIEFEGLDSFRDQVLFAKPKESEEHRNLMKLADIVVRCFSERCIGSTDNRPFNAHMTIAKLSNAPELRRIVKKFKPDDYSQYATDTFGTEDIKVIQLCSMLKPKQDNGYYHVAEELPLFVD